MSQSGLTARQKPKPNSSGHQQGIRIPYTYSYYKLAQTERSSNRQSLNRSKLYLKIINSFSSQTLIDTSFFRRIYIIIDCRRRMLPASIHLYIHFFFQTKTKQNKKKTYSILSNILVMILTL